MIKCTTWLLVVLFLVPGLAAAQFYGGDTNTIHTFPHCYNVTVLVEGELVIDSGELWFEDCEFLNKTSNYSETWFCDCNDSSFDLRMSTQVNTINQYNFTMEYKSEMVDEPTVRRSSGRSIGLGIELPRQPHWFERIIFIEPVEREVFEPEDPVTPPDEEEPIIEPEPEPEPEPEKPNYLALVLFALLLVLAVYLVGAIWKDKKKD